MYDQTARMSSRETRYGYGTGRKRSERRERTELLRLLICGALFLTVFIGKGVLPNRLVQLKDNLAALLAADTDFRGAFTRVGESLEGESSVLETLGEFCVEVFGPERSEPKKPEPDQSSPMPRLTSLLQSEQEFFSGSPDTAALSAHYRSVAEQDVALDWASKPASEPIAAPAPDPPVEAAVPAVGTVVLKSAYNGKALPPRYTMDQLSLGALETTTPLVGRITSEFGYRDHPISGVYHFHGGLDVGGTSGAPIAAFAAGTVDYVGKDDSFGLYLQLDHGDGIKSFYAHCSKVCVTKGQKVALGEKIAEVGSTGSSTGPHLHLELKCGAARLNPIYYVNCLSDQ